MMPSAEPHRTRSDAVLEAVDIHWTVGGAPILNGISLSVVPGEVLALVGPNGAGKSTLLSVLAGDTKPSAGQVLFEGRPLIEHPLADLARQRSVLLQENRLAFPFRVVDVVRMGRSPWRGSPAEDDDEQVVAAALDLAEIGSFAARTFTTLSGGEKARTAFARSLSQQGTVLLLDEPTAALDIRHQERLLATLRALGSEGAAVVVVLHDLALAAAYADRVALIANGRLAAVGTPEEVITGPMLSTVYQHPIDVIRHPGTGALLIAPSRGVPADPVEIDLVSPFRSKVS